MASDRAAAIGQRLRERREELGWTRRRLAAETDGLATENDIYRWESGKHRPQDDTLAALARAMDRDFAWALGEGESLPTPDLANGVSQLDRIEAKLDQLLAGQARFFASVEGRGPEDALTYLQRVTAFMQEALEPGEQRIGEPAAPAGRVRRSTQAA